MRKMFLIMSLIFLSSLVFAKDCVEPFDGMEINSSREFCSDTFDLPFGIKIVNSDVVVDCNTAVLRGNLGESEVGITIEDVKNITLKNCNIATYNIAVVMKNVTHSLIEDNAFLKGRIGLRMFDSYENLIQDNLDKSTTKSISAINSKFNVVMLDNKNIEQGFCDVNSCNRFVDVDVCVDDDFYCSSKCNPENDNDCKGLSTVAEENSSSVVSEKDSDDSNDKEEDDLEMFVEEDEADFVQSSEENDFFEGFSWNSVLFFSILIYIISFLLYQLYQKFSEGF